MKWLPVRIRRVAWVVAACGVVVIVGGSAWLLAGPPRTAGQPVHESKHELARGEKVRRVSADELYVPPDVAAKMELRTGTASTPNRSRKLPAFPGVLSVDPNQTARVRSPFAGEVFALATPDGKADTSRLSAADGPNARAVRVGDRVAKGQILAVVWSRDLGEKKSELLSAISARRNDKQLLDRLRESQGSGAVPLATLWQAEQKVEQDRIAEERAELTLRMWRLSDADIAAIRAEADRLAKPGASPVDPATWARVEIRSPQDGVVVEKNVAPGAIVDPSADLFVVTDTSRLTVWAHVYEEDLPLVQSLPKPVRWTVTLNARPGVSIPGTLESVGQVIDPNAHTALVTGAVGNPTGELKSGMSVSVTVDLPPPEREVEVPASAVAEDGRESVVFVQPDPNEPVYVRRTVRVARRFQDVVYLVTEPGGVKPGDRVLTSGSLLLNEAMADLPVATQ